MLLPIVGKPKQTTNILTPHTEPVDDWDDKNTIQMHFDTDKTHIYTHHDHKRFRLVSNHNHR